MSPHLLSVDSLSRDYVEHLMQLAGRMEPFAQRRKVTRVLEGAVLGNLFFEASTRTRISFHAAFSRLGGSVCDTTGFTFSSMAKGESLYDTSRVMGGYVDAIVLRHPDQGAVAEFAEATRVPVINGGDGPGEHPSQALLDLYTIEKEFTRLGKRLEGAHLLLTGDLKHGRTVHSLIKLLSLFDPLRITLVSPPGLEMPRHLIDLVASRGHRVEQRESLANDFGDLDVIYTTRIQKERFTDEMSETFAGISQDFIVDRAFLDKRCSPTTIVMHPLPRDSRPGANDLNVDLNGDPRLAIFRQADNGIPMRMAIFANLLRVEDYIERDAQDVRWFVPPTFGVDDRTL
ncbi:aspartate carbamoyltransferase [Chromohalobacter israelensis]|jgi:aspartate carbamoyltransferase catalytic subunit|uniref:Aspartate carbamoyltransferase n=1 Tax=Chromohalobacter israelensis (strain ATCC BAA-138 / DSM 3043 / CIP 106854 / NCIMB 13768 / 1H11) TaxID=290398 RepID=Q1R1I1_CHRI1|nr:MULTISPECIES: aspartate carbamoyltransferase [Chromohalobacter]ABE57427.1 aspartate carbamoyltransferase [Chromohalobacter salexigens DSM 3043]NQY45537.1 aspartate carbamoyltransferase [Chromohalobacter sp.]NWO55384.1 aspartate carbamoyltransferase [Chromohalobacter salexigens]RXE46619.1 aspartate carbamoyltransferase [Chromohalobacter salexigens]